MTLRLNCPMCGTWSVSYSAAEQWTAPDGTVTEVIAGRCDRCDSRVLTEPSPAAVDTARQRVAVLRAGTAPGC